MLTFEEAWHDKHGLLAVNDVTQVTKIQSWGECNELPGAFLKQGIGEEWTVLDFNTRWQFSFEGYASKACVLHSEVSLVVWDSEKCNDGASDVLVGVEVGAGHDVYAPGRVL